MKNGLLLLGYFALFFTVVAVRDSLPDNDLAIAGIAGALLFIGLALWVYVAQDYRSEGTDS